MNFFTGIFNTALSPLMLPHVLTQPPPHKIWNSPPLRSSKHLWETLPHTALIGCMIFLSLFLDLDVLRMSMSTVSIF